MEKAYNNMKSDLNEGDAVAEKVWENEAGNWKNCLLTNLVFTSFSFIP
ncbi:MAG: hypothetical protein K8S16_19875 [Bacteroidales bacterium]|nr:hypothetical protein [Bacteroidales bacterium]